MKKIKNINGESLLEVIIAFIVFAMGLTISGMILGSALRNMQNAKNRVVAVNIAREGIEAVRNIRDTNWLKFHSKRRACWNQTPERDPNTQCDGSDPIKPGKYTIFKQGGYPDASDQLTYRWRFGQLRWGGLPENNEAPVCSTAGDYYYNTVDGETYRCSYDGTKNIWRDMAMLSLVDIDPMVDTDNNGDYTDDNDLYNNMYVYPEDNILGQLVKDTIFNRTITIQYLTNDGVVINDPNDYEANVNRMMVRSTVTWKSGGHLFKVELVTHLTDYLGREKLAG